MQPVQATSPTLASLLARVERAKFARSGLRIGRRSTVHGVRWRTDGYGELRAAPACHVGHDRPDGDESIRPVRDRPVTCRLCLTRTTATEEGEPYVPHFAQGSLFGTEEGLPALPRFPPDDIGR